MHQKLEQALVCNFPRVHGDAAHMPGTSESNAFSRMFLLPDLGLTRQNKHGTTKHRLRKQITVCTP